MNNWTKTHEVTDADAALTTTTEVLELPHGCLVRTTVLQGNDGKLLRGTVTVATALAFVPNLSLDRRATILEFKFQA